MITKFANAIIFALILSVSTSSAVSQSWPAILSATRTIHENNVGSYESGFDLKILGKSGYVFYVMKFHSGNYDEGPEIYSGLIQCYLFSNYEKETTQNLFSESHKESADWTNRARFLSHHVQYPCNNYPDWGAVRNFYLRHMHITLSISNEKFDAMNKIKYFDFTATIQNDVRSRSPIAEHPSSPEPNWFYRGPCSAAD